MPPVVDPPPAIELVGTSAPGDVWTFTNLGAPNDYRLGHDNGTPANTADDWSVKGQLSGLGTIPGAETQDADGIYIFRPDGTPPEQGIRFVRLSGFGWAFYVPAGVAHPEPTTVVAVERANCAIPANGDYRTFEVAAPTRPDGFRAPSSAQFSGSNLAILPYRAETAGFRWDMGMLACGAGNTFHPATTLTYWTRAPNSTYAYSNPTPAEVTGAFSPSGAFMLDYGKGFGGTIGVPESNTLPQSEMDIAALAPLYRSRAFAGYFTSTVVVQPAGKDRQDPRVARTAITRAYWMSLGTTDNALTTVSLRDMAGNSIASGATASFELSALNGETGGAVLLVNSRNQGVNDLTLSGPILRAPSNPNTISLVISGYSGSIESNAFLDSVRPPVPAGQEIYSSLYVAYLTLVPPRNCNAPTLQRPADVVPAYLADATEESVRISPTATGIDLTTASGRRIPSSPAHPINGLEVKPANPLTIDDPAPGHVWRLFCGPDYLWAPGARQDGQLGHGWAKDHSLQAGGTYILEHGLEQPTANPDPSAKHVVIHVIP